MPAKPTPTTDPIDLDALRTGRPAIEQRDVILNGTAYHVPTRITVPLAVAGLKGDLPTLIAGLFGDQAAAVLAEDPPLEVSDLLAIVTALTGGPGNLPGSTGS